MKKILILIDGLGDVGYDKFNGKTPLEAAETPNLDLLAKKSSLGFMYPVSEDYAPESDTAVVSILGNDFELSSRAQFEALGEGIKTKRGDLIFWNLRYNTYIRGLYIVFSGPVPSIIKHGT